MGCGPGKFYDLSTKISVNFMTFQRKFLHKLWRNAKYSYQKNSFISENTEQRKVVNEQHSSLIRNKYNPNTSLYLDVSFHEAGHAFMCLEFVKEVEIFPNGSGICRLKNTEQHVIDLFMCYVAGGVSSALYRGEQFNLQGSDLSKSLLDGCSIDLTYCFGLILDSFPNFSFPKAINYLSTIVERVDSIMLKPNNWKVIEAIATNLSTQKLLTKKDLVNIISQID